VPFSEVFAIDPPEEVSSSGHVRERALPVQLYLILALTFVMAITSQVLPERSEIIPQRNLFADFPLNIDGRKGKSNELESIYLESLKLSDYALIDYAEENGKLINFYVAYYESQRKGVSAHSPRTCLPGGGWRIKELDQIKLDGVTAAGKQLEVNRVVIQLGDNKQLVYYWFQQRGRIITSEYLVKWYLFWDSLTKQRTDGALVRLTAMVPPDEEISKTDELLHEFAKDVSTKLDRYIPE
jgi:EpsI family protein